jgi:IS1 family transposase
MRCGVLLKKQKNLTPLEYQEGEFGDAWIWIAFDSIHKVVIAYTVGKRILPKARELLHTLRQCVSEEIPYFTSDELDHYTCAIVEEYGIETSFPNTGKRGCSKKSIKEIPPLLIYTRVHKHRERGRVQKVDTRCIFGTATQVKGLLLDSSVSNSVNTTFVERNNLTIRQQNGRFQRKTLQFSKKKALFSSQLHLFFGYYHFIRPHQSLRIKNTMFSEKWKKQTPFMSAGIVDHIWTFRELYLYKIYRKRGGET